MNAIQELTAEFVSKLTVVVEQSTREMVLAALGAPTSNGHPQVVPPSAARARKKPPVQLCPVPRCTGVAAPVFGMVCRKHKDVPKRQIEKFREARRARKARAA